MLDIKFVRQNPELVKQNIRNKFQDSKLALVDEVIELDEQCRAAIQEANDLRANRNRRHSRRGLVGGSTVRRTPISRSPLDKNPMPGHLSKLHPVNEVPKALHSIVGLDSIS